MDIGGPVLTLRIINYFYYLKKLENKSNVCKESMAKGSDIEIKIFIMIHSRKSFQMGAHDNSLNLNGTL